MIRQLFSMLWKRKKSNFLLVFQLFISFLAMTVFIAINIEKFSGYFLPYHYDYENVWAISVAMDGIPKEQGQEYLELLKQRLKALPGTEVVSNTSLIPFTAPDDRERVTAGGQKMTIPAFRIDENLHQVLRLPLLQGRWLNQDDRHSAIMPVVVTRDFSEEYFKGSNPLGKELLLGERKARIVGVSEEYRDRWTGILGMGKGHIFEPLPADTVIGDIILRSNQAEDFLLMEELVRKELSLIKHEKFVVGQSAPVTMIKKMSNKMDLVQLTITLLVFAFLLLNIFLGVSGVFSYKISKRKSEIGLRVATGAGPDNILRQFLGESMLLASFAVVPGVIVISQLFLAGFPNSRMSLWEQFAGIGGAALFIYLLMISCCVYPALRASKVRPAEVLHEE